jgi:hypothetical protein
MTAPLTPSDVAARWSKPDRPFPRRRVLRWCEKGVFTGAFRVGNRWAIPLNDVLLREGQQGPQT